VEPQLRNYLLRQEFETVLAALRDKYTVEIVGEPEADEDAGAAPAEEPAADEAPKD
jgi:hypothetical protein